MSLTITGNVIEDEGLGITSPLATDVDASNPDNNVTFSNFPSSLDTELTTDGYPSASTAIGIASNAIVSTTDTNLIFSNSSGGALVGVATGITALDGNEIFLYSDPNNSDIVLGIEGTGTTANPIGAVAFALLLQPTTGGATIWTVQYEALTNTNPAGPPVGEDGNTLDLSGLVSVTGSTTSTSSFNIGTKSPGQNYWLPFTASSGGTSATVIVTGLDSSATSPDTVNTSSVGDGSNSQAITPGGALRFDFVSSFTGGSTKDKTFLTDGSLTKLVYIEGTGASFDISQVTPTGKSISVQIIAQNESAGTFDGEQTNTSTNTVALGEIDVKNTSTGALIASSTTGDAAGIHFGVTGGGALTGEVDGLHAGETIQFTSLNNALFDQFVVENINPPKGAGFDILNVTETQSTTTTDHQEVGSHIIFEDSVPTASANTVAKTVDEDGLLSAPLNTATNMPETFTFGKSATGSVTTLFNPGVDTPLTFRLQSDTSSLTSQSLESGGTALVYSVSSDHTTLTATAGNGGATVFTLTLNTSGDFTFTLSAPVDHAPGANDSSQTTIDFSALVQATDADGNFAAGDTATAATNALTVTVIDDVPVNFNPEAIVSADNVQDAATSTFTGKLVNTDSADGIVDPNSTLTIDQHAGADGFGALTFTGTNGAQLQGTLDGGSAGPLTTVAGSNVYLFGFGTGNELYATTDSTGAGLPGGATGTVNTADEVFTITTDHTAGTYTFDMLQAIGNGSRTNFSDFADVPPGDYAWFALPFGPIPPGPVQNVNSVVFTGSDTSVDTVNPSSTGVGTDKQAVADGKSIRVDFVNSVDAIGTKTDLKSISTLGYGDHYDVNDSGFTLSQVNGSGGPNAFVDIRLDAYEVAHGALNPGGTFPSDSSATPEAITEVKLATFDSSGNETVLADFTGDGQKTITAGGKTETVTFNFAPTGDANGVDVEGLKYIPGVFILASTATGFDRLLATNLDTTYGNAGHSFDMGTVSAGIFQAGSAVNMAFNLALRDADAFASNPTSFTEAGTGTLNINLSAPTHA
jgi:T1SS-143 domain-containing protein